MKKFYERYALAVVLLITLLVGQLVAYLASPSAWSGFVAVLGRILSMVAFWGPIILIIASVFVMIVMRLLGFGSLSDIRRESVEQNNPAPAIIFTGTLIASILFLMLVIKP